MLHYATNKSRCRSRMLQEYFGEKDARDCGQCDVCTAGQDEKPDSQEFERIRQYVREKLLEQQMTSRDLINHAGFTQDKMLRVIEWLMDNGQVIHAPDGRLSWDKKNQAGKS